MVPEGNTKPASATPCVRTCLWRLCLRRALKLFAANSKGIDAREAPEPERVELMTGDTCVISQGAAAAESKLGFCPMLRVEIVCFSVLSELGWAEAQNHKMVVLATAHPGKRGALLGRLASQGGGQGRPSDV